MLVSGAGHVQRRPQRPAVYLSELRRLRDNPARVAVVGVGRMGRGIVDQISTMSGLRVVALADLDGQRARLGFTENGWSPDDVVATDSASAAADALGAGKAVASTDPVMLAELEVDAVVEATGVPE